VVKAKRQEGTRRGRKERERKKDRQREGVIPLLSVSYVHASSSTACMILLGGLIHSVTLITHMMLSDQGQEVLNDPEITKDIGGKHGLHLLHIMELQRELHHPSRICIDTYSKQPVGIVQK